MDSPLIGGLLAFLGGAAISVLNYRINLRILKKAPSYLTHAAILRQLLSVGYLAAAFFLARVLPWDYVPLLVGAAAGLTLPAILLSLRLAKVNDSLSSGTGDSSEKGVDSNG